jgi:hypothetical protein
MYLSIFCSIFNYNQYYHKYQSNLGRTDQEIQVLIFKVTVGVTMSAQIFPVSTQRRLQLVHFKITIHIVHHVHCVVQTRIGSF